MTEDQIRAFAKLLEECNIKRFKNGEFEMEMGGRLIQRSSVSGTTTDKASEQAIEKQIFGDPIFKGLSDDQLLGLEPIPDDHPAAKLRKG